MSMRRCRTYVSLAIIIFFSSVAFYGYYCEHLLQPRLRDTRPPKKAASDENWNFKRDARNLLMNETQCDLAFPDLFKDIDRAVASRQSNRITLKEIDETEKVRGYTRAIIYDQNVWYPFQKHAANNTAKTPALHYRRRSRCQLSRLGDAPRPPSRDCYFPRTSPKHRIHSQCR